MPPEIQIIPLQVRQCVHSMRQLSVLFSHSTTDFRCFFPHCWNAYRCRRTTVDAATPHVSATDSTSCSGWLFESSDTQPTVGPDHIGTPQSVADKYQSKRLRSTISTANYPNSHTNRLPFLLHTQQLQVAQTNMSRGINHIHMSMNVTKLKQQISNLQSQIAQQQAAYVNKQPGGGHTVSE